MITLAGTTPQGTVYRGYVKILGEECRYSLTVKRPGEGWRLISYTAAWKLADAELYELADGLT